MTYSKKRGLCRSGETDPGIRRLALKYGKLLRSSRDILGTDSTRATLASPIRGLHSDTSSGARLNAPKEHRLREARCPLIQAMASVNTLPIAQLQPGLDPDSTSVTGIVTLIWPYASSTRTLSLLLVEPDFRLRRHRGQVRVHFHGSSAKALSRAGVSSGDQLLLNLTGVQWAKDTFTASTPGKGIEWELRYGERAVLQVCNIQRTRTGTDDMPDPARQPRGDST